MGRGQVTIGTTKGWSFVWRTINQPFRARHFHQVSSRPPRMHPSFIAAAPTHWGRVGRVVDARDFDQTEHQWRFPIHGGTPVHHPLDNGIFHEIIHPAIGVPPWLRKPPYMGVSEDEVAVYPKNVHFRRDMLPSFSGKPIWGHNLWPRDCRFCFTSCQWQTILF